MKPGDILAVRGRNWFSRGILRATGGTASHLGMLIGASPPIVLEALSRVRTRPLADSIADAEAAWLLSDKSLNDPQRERLVSAACAFSADGYGYADIALQGLDAVCRTTWFTDHLAVGLLKHPICSFVVAHSYELQALRFGAKHGESITPADVFAFALRHPEIYEITQIKGP